MPSVGGLKEAGLGSTGIREGAALEAEELGFEQGFRNRRTVDDHKRPVAPGAGAVDEPGHEPLAGAGFALDEDRREAPASLLAVQQPAQLLPDDIDGRVLTEQFGKLVHMRSRLPVCSTYCSDFLTV